MTKWKQYLVFIGGGEAKRLERLTADGRTLELERIDRNDHVVRIALGFGDEFWRVEPGYRLQPLECSIEGGQLIVDQGVRVADEEKLAFLARRVERVVYTV